MNDGESPIPWPAPGDSGPVAAMRRLLDDLAALIEQIEVKIERGTQGALPRLIAENEAATRRIMEGIGTILHDVGRAGEAPEVAAQVRELATTRLVAWSSTSPVSTRAQYASEDFSNFEVMLLVLENRLGGGDMAAQILDHFYLNMVISSSFRNRLAQIADLLADEARRRVTKGRPARSLTCTRTRAANLSCSPASEALSRSCRSPVWIVIRQRFAAPGSASNDLRVGYNLSERTPANTPPVERGPRRLTTSFTQ